MSILRDELCRRTPQNAALRRWPRWPRSKKLQSEAVLRVDLLEKARNSKQNILLDQSLSWLIMIDHHNDELWWNGSSRWTSMDQWIGEIQAIPWDFLYIFYICPIYIYMCPIFHGKKAMDSGEEFPFNQSISPVLPTFRSWSTSKKSWRWR